MQPGAVPAGREDKQQQEYVIKVTILTRILSLSDTSLRQFLHYSDSIHSMGKRNEETVSRGLIIFDDFIWGNRTRSGAHQDRSRSCRRIKNP